MQQIDLIHKTEDKAGYQTNKNKLIMKGEVHNSVTTDRSSASLKSASNDESLSKSNSMENN